MNMQSGEVAGLMSELMTEQVQDLIILPYFSFSIHKLLCVLILCVEGGGGITQSDSYCLVLLII